MYHDLMIPIWLSPVAIFWSFLTNKLTFDDIMIGRVLFLIFYCSINYNMYFITYI